MTTSFDSFQKRRLQSSYISVVVSIALVLFMIGVLGLVLLKSTKVANHFKEKVVMTLFLKDEVADKNIKSLKESIKKEEFVNKVVYISKEDAAKEYKKDLGEDFLQFLGDNPLKNGIDIYLKADFVTPEKMSELEKSFDKNKFVDEVSYDKPLVQLLTKNIQRISFWLLVLSGFFGLVAIILINSSIRLSIYSKRFNIKTMQMVGATKSFIRKPFIWQSIKLGLLGAFIAISGLGILIYYVDKYIPTLELLTDYVALGYVAGGVILVAFFITWISTFFATQRFLNLQTNDLYY
ncbi:MULTISPECIES: cell division protein FtsX [Tenacibaculum]|uniref:Cell division protein FtsX n=2 Tax=Tenacibaculum TaxID=104267 RepID=A0AAE9MPU0_9FLAO|nr:MULTISPECIES: permease-like cell division protein FtsX [Tenacibaculum]AZJ33371.1 FtsX-like permease family protein [Tenacibaculum mesophilum]KAF9659618.1 FtsX-like permease family protein [Tenacibaculum mesophilum]MCG7500353.1 permease-like cell division protein FtsX [Tenacibaculum sp. Mcav3-52]MCO7184580.1 permease-like cell division protein FtsX [Tenacibaculum sp. XPcli2-G]QFS28614.1 FtsX-like permease family protein [Tenacibaculum mesophilum]